jgi:hypothetical protein
MAGIVRIAPTAVVVDGQRQYVWELSNQLGTKIVPLGSINDVQQFATALQQNGILNYFAGKKQQITNNPNLSDADKQSMLEEVETCETNVINALKTSSQFDIGTSTLVDVDQGGVLNADDELVDPISDEALEAAIEALAGAAA